MSGFPAVPVAAGIPQGGPLTQALDVNARILNDVGGITFDVAGDFVFNNPMSDFLSTGGQLLTDGNPNIEDTAQLFLSGGSATLAGKTNSGAGDAGFARLRGGTGGSPGFGHSAYVIAGGGLADGTHARLEIRTNNTTGTIGRPLVSDGAGTVIFAAVPAFQALTTPPVSTTVYENTLGKPLIASLKVTLAVNPALASDCKVEISPDNFASAVVFADPSFAAGAVAVGGDIVYITFPIPVAWFYKVTATNATIGALVAVG